MSSFSGLGEQKLAPYSSNALILVEVIRIAQSTKPVGSGITDFSVHTIKATFSSCLKKKQKNMAEIVFHS